MAIFSSEIDIFKIAFQDVVDNSWKIPIAPFSTTNFIKKIITLCAASEKTPPRNSWPITMLPTMDQRRQNVWVGAWAGTRIYSTGTKYMRIIYP